MRRTVGRALEHWVAAGLLTAQQAEELGANLDQSQSGHAIRVFAGIGAALAGSGAMLFVASHWDAIGPVTRCLVLFATYLAAVAGAIAAERRNLPTTAKAAWLVVSAVFGANIFLLAQIFNFSLTYWQGPFWWMVGALALGWALESSWQAALAIPIGLLALGWIGGGQGWFFDDQMEFLASPRGLRPLLPLIGMGLVSVALVSERTAGWKFVSTAAFRWGLLLVAIPVVVSTAYIDVAAELFKFEGGLKQILIVAGVVIAVVAAAWLGEFESREGRLLHVGAALFSALLLFQGSRGSWVGSTTSAFVVYIVLMFVLALFTLWVGVRARDPRLVNAGLVSAGVLIFIQYWSWSFALFDRSLVFMGGGLLLLLLSVVLERKRRQLLAELEHAS